MTRDPSLNIVPSNRYRPPFWVQTDNPRTSGLREYPLGTDLLGRDLLTRLLYGGRVSLVVAIVPTVITITAAMVVGIAAGLAGGRIDHLLMRFTDVILAFPDLLFLVVFLSSLRHTWLGAPLSGMLLLFIGLSITSWPVMARLVRAKVLSVKEMEFMLAARATGARWGRIVMHHLVPNILAPVLVSAPFLIAGMIAAEAGLSFLGLGIRPSTPGTPAPFPTSWGVLLSEGLGAGLNNPWLLIWSCVCIGVTVLAFAVLGDGLRDALDPQMKR